MKDINGSVYLCDDEVSDDDIVISGISGRFPNSHNVEELSHNLYNKIDMCDDDDRRFPPQKGIPPRHGKVYDLNKFDATFFGVNEKLANCMDPQIRCILEHVFEAILDAGLSPIDLKGSNTAVVNAISTCESEWPIFRKGIFGGYSLVGTYRGMFANRISYTLNLKGPSYVLDTACSSSTVALDTAYKYIKNGFCDAAIVGTSSLNLSPIASLQFAKLGVTAPDGFCRPFDQNACGYTRAEAICCVLIQKRKDAKRCYATILHTKTNNDGYKPEGITFPSRHGQRQLMEQFYNEIKIDPSTINYVEAHATATKKGDPEECESIYQVFCKNRKSPLLIGSLKSNMGHAEAASGLCSVIKCLITLQNTKIPPNINYNTPKKEITSIINGHLKVVDEVTDLPGPLVACSSFGFGGSNGHILLKRNSRQKINHGIPSDEIPRLVCWSTRAQIGCDAIFDDICTRPLDAEYVALIHSSQSKSLPENMTRGYGVFKQNGDASTNAICVARDTNLNDGGTRPLVWVFSGMGSQWLEMGSSLMTLPLTRKSLEYCHSILKGKNLDLLNILTSSDKTTYDNILHSFVGIAAIQIALVDLLRSLKIQPDYIIGHSVGELGCAYADECFTAEEMILSAYSRGMASLETKVVFGSMAAIGLGYKQIRPMLPEGIEVACHNGPDSSTISGPADLIASFVKTLTDKGIFAREVPCSNIPYHSKYIADMGPNLLSRLKAVIKNPKERSHKWLSTSYPKEKWEQPEAKLCSPHYHTNNLLSSVLFEETLTLLPDNAVTVEIAPHGLLQAILRKALPGCKHINLTQRGNKENLTILLSGLGKLFLHGFDMPLDTLYPKVHFPVSVGTPMIASLASKGWDHSEDYLVVDMSKDQDTNSAECRYEIHLKNPDYRYLSGHMIDGRILFPATGYVKLVWEVFSNVVAGDKYFTDVPVELTDIKFLQATTLSEEKSVELIVVVHPFTGKFEIRDNEKAIVTGNIKLIEKINETKIPKPTSEAVILSGKDFYKELKLRGYHYNGEFKNVLESRSDGLGAKILWNENFISLMDCMLQVSIIGLDSRQLMVPTRIDRLLINPSKFRDSLEILPGSENSRYASIVCNNALKLVQTPGIEIRGLKASTIARRKSPGEPVLESYKFIPYNDPKGLTFESAIRIFVQLGLENDPLIKVKTVELLEKENEILTKYVQQALNDLPTITAEQIVLSNEENLNIPGVSVIQNGKLNDHNDINFVIGSGFCQNSNDLEKLSSTLRNRAFIISRELHSINLSRINLPIGFSIISTIRINDQHLVLIQWIKKQSNDKALTVKISNEIKSFEWIDELKEKLKIGKVYVVSEKNCSSGVLGLVNCLRREPNTNVACIFLCDADAPDFNPELPFYKQQLEKNLAINIFKNNSWGSYRHLSLDINQKEKHQSSHCYANCYTLGNLSSLKWSKGPLDINQTNIVTVKYSSLNFKDVMIATGKIDVNHMYHRLNQDCILGFEYSGVTKDGRRVMGFNLSGAVATYLEPIPYLFWEVPDQWSLEEAATVPVVYTTVYAALFIETKIEAGKKILIHAGTGGIGLSAIRVAMAYGLDVFTTVSTPEKKQYLLDLFPDLKESQVGNSRDTTFYEMVMLETNGQGVDYVLNSLADDKLISSIMCLARNGKFIEIGKYDILNNSPIGLGHFEKNITFHVVMLDENIMNNDIHVLKGCHDLIKKDIARGIIKPLKTKVFPASDVETAFRYLASAKHIGKVILQIREHDFDSKSLPISVLPKCYFNSSMCYIIPGGLGGIGIELADWLVTRGARNLVLSSSRGISSSYQEYRMKLWKSYGVKVLVSTANITTYEGCLKLIKTGMQLAPIRGIFNLAVVLRDSIFENQNAQKFDEALSVKAYSTKYLDEISRKLCTNLKYFVVFSSVSCGRGNAGQSNYGMANSIMERIIEDRVASGYPGKAVQWGAVGEVGIVANLAENKIDLEIGGTLQQRISSCLQVLDTLLTCPDPIVGSMVVAEKRSTESMDLLDAILRIIGIKDIKSVLLNQKLSEVGMDSLMSVEIKQTLERDFDVSLSPDEMRTLTFGKLVQLSQKESSVTNSDSPKKSIKLDVLFRNLGDEKKSDVKILNLKSNFNSKDNKIPMIIIPGIEGVVGAIWDDIAAKLDHPVYMLQYKNSVNATDISQITDTIIKDTMINILKNDKNFLLIGYSFGTLIVLDMVKRLENMGLHGKVILIDGSPLWANEIIKVLFPHTNGDKLQNMYMSVASTLNRFAPDKAEIDITKFKTWDEIVEKIYETNAKTQPYSKEYAIMMMKGIFNRIQILANPEITKMKSIQSDILLVKSEEPIVTDIETDYGLMKYTSGKVHVKTVKGNHMTMLEQTELINILNNV